MIEIKVSVIIPTCGKPRFLVKTIRSLKEQDFSGYEIIVVDNACSESTKKLVEQLIVDVDKERYLIKYLCEPSIGLHNARHTGAKVARGEILLYIDDDILADENLVKEVFNSYKSIDIGCVGGKILPKWEIEPPEWIKLFPKWYLSILDDEEKTKEVQWIYGCNFSIRKELLFKVGGFNPDAFSNKKMWWMRGDGEAGLLKKVHRVDKKVIYNPNCITWHFIPKERLSVNYFKERSFKSGVEASFSRFHYNKEPLNVSKLILRSGIFAIYYFFHSLLAFIPYKNGIRHKVTKSYYKARYLYELKLAMDKDLQEFVKKKKWLK